MDVFIKTDDRSPRALELEALGLGWLGEAMGDGGALTAPVLGCEGAALRLPRIWQTEPTPAAARAFGRALALTHAAGAPDFGSGPPGWEGRALLGRSRQPINTLAPAGAWSSWGQWFAQERLLLMVKPARDNGSLDSRGVQRIEKVAARLVAGEFDAPQPALVKAWAARIHGDLWCGNVLWTPRERLHWLEGVPGAELAGRGRPAQPLPAVVGVLIDPLAHGGHAETDLGHLAVFGQPYLSHIYAGYQEVSCLASGWEERAGLAVLQMIVMHAAIFGGSYGPHASELAAGYA